MANMMMLGSDDNNPDFVGARNPDDVLFVRFYIRPLQDNFQSTEQGRPIFNDVIFTEIQTPGNQLNIIDRPKKKEDEIRFPRQWQFFQNTHSSDPAKQGTPFSQWPMVTASQVEMLKFHKFHYIEQVAMGSDQQIETLGMTMGMAPHAFREKCKAYLDVARDSNAAVKKSEELAKRDAELAALKEEMAQLKAMISAPKAEVTAATPKKKYVMSAEHKAKLKAARDAAKAARG